MMYNPMRRHQDTTLRPYDEMTLLDTGHNNAGTWSADLCQCCDNVVTMSSDVNASIYPHRYYVHTSVFCGKVNASVQVQISQICNISGIIYSSLQMLGHNCDTHNYRIINMESWEERRIHQ